MKRGLVETDEKKVEWKIGNSIMQSGGGLDLIETGTECSEPAI